jgi:hypothetical protein
VEVAHTREGVLNKAARIISAFELVDVQGSELLQFMGEDSGYFYMLERVGL